MFLPILMVQTAITKDDCGFAADSRAYVASDCLTGNTSISRVYLDCLVDKIPAGSFSNG
jgi:hypothetical protein